MPNGISYSTSGLIFNTNNTGRIIISTGGTISFSGLSSGSDNVVLTIDTSGIIHTFPFSGLTGSSTTLYSGNGSLSSNRTVNTGTNTLNFSSSTYANTLVLSGGSVGIGKSTPTEKLDVSGAIRFSSALMPNNNAGLSGDILFSNGSGAAPYWGALTTENVYTPTVSGITNISSSTVEPTYYIRIGDWCHVWGVVSIIPTSDGNIEFSLDTPICSGLSDSFELAGTAVGIETGDKVLPLRINYGVDSTANFAGVGVGSSKTDFYYTYSYKIIPC